MNKYILSNVEKGKIINYLCSNDLSDFLFINEDDVELMWNKNDSLIIGLIKEDVFLNKNFASQKLNEFNINWGEVDGNGYDLLSIAAKKHFLKADVLKKIITNKKIKILNNDYKYFYTLSMAREFKNNTELIKIFTSVPAFGLGQLVVLLSPVRELIDEKQYQILDKFKIKKLISSMKTIAFEYEKLYNIVVKNQNFVDYYGISDDIFKFQKTISFLELNSKIKNDSKKINKHKL